jgi:hypothetical protein
MASRAARRHLWELVNAKTQFKAAIPVLIDWLRNVEQRIPGLDQARAREGLVTGAVGADGQARRRASDERGVPGRHLIPRRLPGLGCGERGLRRCG